MPRSFDMATDYEAGVEEVHRAYGERRYWLARLAGSGADETALERLEVSAGGGIEVVTVQVLGSGRLPALVSQFHRGDLAIRREETWTPIRDSRAGAVIAGAVSGAPVSLTGEALLAPLGGGARLSVSAGVDVRVPLVGGKLEKFIGNQLMALIVAEQRFTTEWIAEHHTEHR